MTDTNNLGKYDEALLSILVSEKSILGFLSSIFNFLARRTDFYHVPEGSYENIGFPPGVAEELVIKLLRKCDPKNWMADNNNIKLSDINNDIMCSTVAQEIEVVAEEDRVDDTTIDENDVSKISETLMKNKIAEDSYVDEVRPSRSKDNTNTSIESDYTPPKIPEQKNSDAYNGAETEKYSWSQTIMELDATVTLPTDIKTSKDLKVIINAGDIVVQRRSDGEVIIKDSFPYKIKALDSFWSISEGQLMIHLEKQQERWWKTFLSQEKPIDLSKIDCSRPLDELPEDHIAKVRELQWNQEQKNKGLPTTDEIRNMEILKKAWNIDGSPFKGTEFDPNAFRS